MENTKGKLRLERQGPAPSCKTMEKPWGWAHNPVWLVCNTPTPGWAPALCQALSEGFCPLVSAGFLQLFSRGNRVYRDLGSRQTGERQPGVQSGLVGCWASLVRYVRDLASESIPSAQAATLGCSLSPVCCPQTHMGVTQEQIAGQVRRLVVRRPYISGCKVLPSQDAHG